VTYIPQRFKVDWERIIDNDDVIDAAAYWFGECSWTRDEAASGQKSRSKVVKRFPWNDRPDIQLVINYILNNAGVFLAMGSRKILKTWTIANLFAFWAVREEHRNFLLGSTKEERADLNLQRIIQIISTLRQLDTNTKQPPGIIVAARPPNSFHLSNGSVFTDLTLNVRDLVQITSSGVWMDEVSKLPEDYKAAFLSEGLPSTQQAVGDEGDFGSRFIMTCTCEGEERVWRMLLPDEESRRKLISPYEDAENLEGLRCPANGLKIWNEDLFHRILWYYFADPGKCPGTPWFEAERKKWRGNDDGWRRQMEIWPIQEGERRITPEYREMTHRRSFDELRELYLRDVPLVVGWDIGARFQAATVTQCNPKTGQVVAFMQHFEDNKDLHSFAMRLIETIKGEFPDQGQSAGMYHVGDPRTLSLSTMTSMGTAAEYMQNIGIYIAPAPGVTIATKIMVVKRLLTSYTEAHEPMLVIAGDRCREIISGLRGAWEYDQTGMRPKRTGFVEHAIDSLVFCLLQHKLLNEPADQNYIPVGRLGPYDGDGFYNPDCGEGGDAPL